MNIKFDIFNEITWPQFKQLKEVQNLSEQDIIKHYNFYLDQLNVARFQSWYNSQGGGATIASVPTFEFTINTANTFKLPLVSSLPLNARVDWGDGKTDTITTWNQAQTTHTYPRSGIYTIRITGQLSGWRFSSWGGDRTKILNIASWGALNISVDGGFEGCTNLTCTATDAPTISTTSLVSYFDNCTNFNGAIGNWDVSNVTNMSTMFRGAQVFNRPLNSWNVSNVTNMSTMFANAFAFNQPLNSWNVSKVTDMSIMFAQASAFNQPIGSWNVSKVTDMSQMFNSATAFNQPIGSWNVSKVTDMSQMFVTATAFNQDISGWDVSNVTNMNNVFNGATAFNQNISGWDVSKVTSMIAMFSGATAFNQPIGSWNVSNVTNMIQMFVLATSFNQNIGSWNVSKVASFENFMVGKTAADFSATNLDAIYNGWSLRPVIPFQSISFGTIKYTAAGQTGRNTLASNFWSITDGGI